ncbi:esterase [Burkholderia sp. MSh2]|uniref:Esterase n=1 Tax=Burkholderia paludis TaxID=1506587 RepID=A0A6J5DGR1_9BURK|nr:MULTISPECIES: alpha/beta hydrolase-fold protein [Burkholderia]KEZ04306.1 esterase [Burkholderia sp. MSh2]CAB3753318.1 Ferri-bacillibactin esterase BesA [Burkholderia paludis]VWB66844.1 esterase [Burkholderia paludis]
MKRKRFPNESIVTSLTQAKRRLGPGVKHGLYAGIVAMCMTGHFDAVAGPAETAAHPAYWQRGDGQPYEVADTEVRDVPDPASGRDYQVFVALPPSYGSQPQRRYPVLYVTDADYAFPLVKQISRRLNGEGPVVEEFILVGLSYARGETGVQSRRRDYTPTAAGSPDAPADAVHGQAGAYQAYLRNRVLPFMAKQYRTDESRRFFLGHSYGGLLGMRILLTEPDLFRGYLIGSPSLWYDRQAMSRIEAAYAASHHDLPACVFMYVGEYEEVRKSDPRFARTYNMVTDTRNMEKALRSRQFRSLRLRVDVLDDENHLTVAPRGFTHGLEYLLPARAR